MSNKLDDEKAHKYTDYSTMSTITKLASRRNMKSRGIWSHLGEPYVPHGMPNLDLTYHVQQAKMQRTADKRTRENIPEKNNVKKNTNTHKVYFSKHEHLINSNAMSSMTRTDVNIAKNSFPAEALHSANFRRLKKQMKAFFSGSTLEDEPSKIMEKFPILVIRKVKISEPSPTNRPESKLMSCVNRIRTSRSFSVFTNSPLRRESKDFVPESQKGIKSANAVNTDQQTVTGTSKSSKFTLQNQKISWRNEFIHSQEIAERKLREKLVRNEMDREDILEDKKMVGKVSTMATERAKFGRKSNTSIWAQARKEQQRERLQTSNSDDASVVDARKRIDLYRELTVFLGGRHKSVKLACSDPLLVDAVITVKRLLEKFTALENGALFVEAMRAFGNLCFDCKQQMEVLLFLRHNSDLTAQSLQNFILQV